MISLPDHAVWRSHPTCRPPGPVNWLLSLNFITVLRTPQITWNRFERVEVFLKPEKYDFVTSTWLRLRVKYKREWGRCSTLQMSSNCVQTEWERLLFLEICPSRSNYYAATATLSHLKCFKLHHSSRASRAWKSPELGSEYAFHWMRSQAVVWKSGFF